MTITPAVVLSWWDVLNRVGATGMMAALIVVIIWKLPAILKVWGEWIIAIHELTEELKGIKDWCRSHDINTENHTDNK